MRARLLIGLSLPAWGLCAATIADEAPALSFAVADRLVQTRDGLPADQVIAIHEDRSGALWVGTTGGLARLSGPEIRVFGLSDGLPRSVVVSLGEGPDGTLFAGTRGGIARFDPATERFRAEPPPAAGLRVRTLTSGPDGTPWALLGEALVLRLGKGAWQTVALEGAPAFEALAMAVDHRGDVWIGTRRHGLLHFRPEGGALRLLESIGPQDGFPGGEADYVIPDGEGVAATATDALWTIGPLGRRRIPYPPAFQGGHRCLARAGDGRLYIGFDEGLLTVDSASEKAVPVQSLRDAARLPIVRLMVDRAGNLWAGTVDRGLALFFTGAGIAHLRAGQERPGLIYRDDRGAYWAATNDALYRFRLSAQGEIQDAVRATAEGDAPSGYSELREEGTGNLLVAAGGGVTVIPAKARDGARPRLLKDPRFRELDAAFVGRIVRDPRGTFWLGSGRGLFRLRAGASTAENVPLPGTAEGLRLPTVDRTGAVWVSADNGGLWHVSGADPPIIERVVLPPEPAILDYSTLAPGGDLLLAFEDGDSWILDAVTRAPIFRLSAAGPLGRIAPESLLRLPDGRILAAHGAGHVSIISLSPAAMVEPLLSSADLDGVDSHYLSALAEPDGTLWLSGLGVVARVPMNYHPPPPGPLVVESASPALPKEGWLEVGAAPNALDIRLSLPDPVAPRAVRYRFRLGEEEPFSAWTSDPRLHFANLPHGEAVLEVEAEDRYGRPASNRIRVPIRVAPRFYETALFVLTLGLGFSMVAFGLHRLRLRRAEHEQERLREAVRLRTAELAEANARLAEASLTDALTGLSNRRVLSSLIESLVPSVLRQRREGVATESLVCYLVDVDHFKPLNDTFGHSKGDEVLVATARALKSAARGSAAVIRFGGEEFLVVDRTWNPREAHVLAERLRRSVEVAGEELGISGGVTVSVGCCSFPFWEAQPGLVTWEDTVRLADQALYRAKDLGRNRWARVEGVEEALEKVMKEKGEDELKERLREMSRALDLLRFTTGPTGEGGCGSNP